MIRKNKSANEITKEQEQIFKCVIALNDLCEKLEYVSQENISEIVETQFGFSQDKIENMQSKEEKTDLEKLFLKYIATPPLSEKPQIENMSYIRPNTVTMPTPKPVEEIFDGVDLTVKKDIVVSSNKSDEKYVVPTQVVVVPDSEDHAVNMNRKLTPFDRTVFNGICSIYKAGNDVFTVKQVYHAMGGKGNPRPETLDRIKFSIMKMRATFVSVDWSEHMRMRGFSISKKVTMKTDSAMMSLEGIQLKVGGQQVSGYKFISDLPLLKYADSVDQICTINREMLNVSLVKTDENIILVQFLARWLNYNKTKNAGKKQSISYSTIFSKIGLDIEKTERHKRKRIIESIKKILAEWKDKEYISNFSEYLTRKQYAGIVVEFTGINSDEINDCTDEEI